jgi:hypothetical protein
MGSASSFKLEVKHAGDTTLSQFALDVTVALKHESVVAVRSERVGFTKAVVNQQRQVVLACETNRYIQGRVFVRPQGVMHPVQNERSAGRQLPGYGWGCWRRSSPLDPFLQRFW